MTYTAPKLDKPNFQGLYGSFCMINHEFEGLSCTEANLVRDKTGNRVLLGFGAVQYYVRAAYVKLRYAEHQNLGHLWPYCKPISRPNKGLKLTRQRKRARSLSN
jgi:hypothetical protein